MFYAKLWANFRNYKINRVIKLMIVSDFFALSAANLLAPVFAIFISREIEGATLETIGIATTIYLVCRAALEMPVAVMIDRTKSMADDFYTVFFGTLITGFLYFMYLFVHTVTGLYIIEILLGASAALLFPGWCKIFTRLADRSKEGVEWGIHNVATGVGMAIAATVGAVIADKLGFHALVVIVGILILTAALILLSLKNKIIIHNA
jgi:sugar phosphate permease